MRGLNRREALRFGLGAGAGLVLSGCAATTSGERATVGRSGAVAATQEPVRYDVRVTPLGDRLALLSGAGGNVVALRSDAGVLLVDTGAPGATAALQVSLREFSGGMPVTTVINTHWHEAHTGGNDIFATAGAKIIAHAKAAQRMRVPQYVPKEDRYLPARAPASLPGEVYYVGSRQLAFGNEQVEYGYLQQPHTDGDSYVLLKSANLLIVGDAVAPVSDPEICWYEGGWVGGRADSQARFLAMGDGQTRIIAGTGGVISRVEVQTEHDALVAMFDRVSESMRKGLTTEDMQRAKLLDGLPRTWADPDKALYDAHKSMWAHYNKLSHSIV